MEGKAVIDNLSKYTYTPVQDTHQNKIYAITELERNFQDDEYKVKAWLL